MRVSTSGQVVKLTGTLRDADSATTITVSGTGLSGRKGKLSLTRKD